MLSSTTCRSNVLAITFSTSRLKQFIFVSANGELTKASCRHVSFAHKKPPRVEVVQKEILHWAGLDSGILSYFPHGPLSFIRLSTQRFSEPISLGVLPFSTGLKP